MIVVIDTDNIDCKLEWPETLMMTHTTLFNQREERFL